MGQTQEGGSVFINDRVIRYVVGQCVNGFTILSYKARDKKNLPVYEVRHTCGALTTMYHRRPYAARCHHCELEATRAVLSKSEALTTKLASIKEYDQSVDAEVTAARQNPQAPTPAPSQQPLRRLTQIEKWELDAALRGGGPD